ncbi:hypothetical protein DFH09DRAFT_989153 [Mycena vulgaris]|nr:hypothetical protein DFH09DRAFT_989153 [Mycena vulgaris]
MDVDSGTPTRVEELWFSDSGLVVQAGLSLFRVSGAVLAARSPVFKDMLAFPQPPDAETIDGCPVVRLPDSAQDVTTFFRAIFDSAFFETFPSRTDMETVISILHLSNKYAVNYLQRRALVHLASLYPTTLEHYDCSHTRNSLFSEPLADVPIAAHVAAIQIAREVNALWILPAAFYAIARTEDDDIQVVLDSVAYNAHSAKLSGDDRLLFLRSSINISVRGQDVSRFLSSPEIIQGCDSGKKCIVARLHFQDATGESYSDHPLGLNGSEEWGTLTASSCRVCRRAFKKTNQEAREAFWDKLPKFCGFPPWEELEKMKEEALQA